MVLEQLIDLPFNLRLSRSVGLHRRAGNGCNCLSSVRAYDRRWLSLQVLDFPGRDTRTLASHIQ